MRIVAGFTLLLAAAAAASGRSAKVVPPERRVAVTFDDLPGPASGLVSNAVPALRENTEKLLASFKKYQVPVVGFVNEGKLYQKGEGPADVVARTKVLERWLAAGHELGNHTYSHSSLNRVPLEEFEADVVRGEPAIRKLLAAHGRTLRYFRHPFLQVGLDLEKRNAFEVFLKDRGYQIAPVTIDDDDYVFAAVYADALRKSDRPTAEKVAAAYVQYMETVFAFVEDVSERLTGGGDIRQILLLHANTLNADHFGRVAERLQKRGYRFISLTHALEDEAYRMPDIYVGEWGISWLHHWEEAAGRPRSPSPDPPAWITQAYEARNR
jgi:peptidoglycan/xylan/chitin deacetylase (PgdA/CDA1 family)